MRTDEEELLKKYQQGNCSPQERAMVENCYLQASQSTQDQLPEPDYDKVKEEIWHSLPPVRRTRIISLRFAAIAASLFICTSLCLIVLRKQDKNIVTAKKADIRPGTNVATLTLANGQKILLTSQLNGTLAQQGLVTIKVSSGKAITYTASNHSNAIPVNSYNTLSTARGQQSPYPLILSDGTRVWLNAASSITFPTAFNAKEREVTVTGEAYLEVFHNAARPFKVKLRHQTIEDIGTAFNINAYDEESTIKTTLIEGSVKVSNLKSRVILKPGQQAEQFAERSDIVLRTVNVEDIMAWKSNYFSFDGDNLETILWKISRWYDVDIVYENTKVKSKFLGGTVSRFANVSSVLKTLEMTKVAHFKLEGRKIIVSQ